MDAEQVMQIYDLVPQIDASATVSFGVGIFTLGLMRGSFLVLEKVLTRHGGQRGGDELFVDRVLTDAGPSPSTIKALLKVRRSQHGARPFSAMDTSRCRIQGTKSTVGHRKTTRPFLMVMIKTCSWFWNLGNEASFCEGSLLDG
jgi:hypothetical protein